MLHCERAQSHRRDDERFGSVLYNEYDLTGRAVVDAVYSFPIFSCSMCEMYVCIMLQESLKNINRYILY